MKVTDKAVEQFKKEMKESETPVSGIRIFTMKGCCGTSIFMKPAEKKDKCEFHININDVDFFIEPEANELVIKATIDYSDGKYKFENLKSSGCC
jgi:Fe-S cluster assembly iron-binding protein IscA